MKIQVYDTHAFSMSIRVKMCERWNKAVTGSNPVCN